jgi:3-oxoacyl-(acyl-carrier-protein) synthase
MAGIGPERIGMVAAGASGHPHGDAMEAAVLRALTPSAPVAAYKARIGECYGASGALCLACALLDLAHGRVSGTGSAYRTLPGVNVSERAVAAPAEYALVNSFGCDGNCGCAVLRKVS